MDIKNIILDLGGVLLNIDYIATIGAFKKLRVSDFENIFTQASQQDVFDRLDKGEISPEGFRDQLRTMTGLNLGDAEIDDAWNAMLLDFPAGRLQLLEKVGRNYRMFLLSNTNAIHYPVFQKYMMSTHGVPGLDAFFEVQYLSHEVGLRKPNREMFQLILNHNQLVAGETFFVDDTLQHVEGARKTGIHAHWLDLSHSSIENLFTSDGLIREGLVAWG